MKRFAAALVAAALVLGGCSTIDAFKQGYEAATSIKVTQKQALLAAEGFDAIKIVATNYLRLRRCTGTNGPICRDPKVTREIEAAIYSGTASRNNLKAYLRAHLADGEDSAIQPVADFNIVQAATAAIQSLTAAYRAAIGAA